MQIHELVEGKNKDGSPNENFMVTKAAAMEVIGTHKGMTGAIIVISDLETWYKNAVSFIVTA